MSDSTNVPNDSSRTEAFSAKKPIRVLIAADTFAPDVNGAARFAERLAAGLVSRGHIVHIMAPAASRKRGSWIEIHEGQPMMVHRLQSWRWYPHDWLRFALPWIVRKHSRIVLDELKPDVVHFQSHINIGRGVTIEAEKRGIRVVGTNHLMPENLLQFSLVPKVCQDRVIKALWTAARRTLQPRRGRHHADPPGRPVPGEVHRPRRTCTPFRAASTPTTTRRTSRRAPRTASCSSAA